MSTNIRGYGDISNLKQDIKQLNDILDRQGTNLIIDVLAEYIGNQNLRWKLTNSEMLHIVDALNSELKEAVLERT
jgi:hypothetical protein